MQSRDCILLVWESVCLIPFFIPRFFSLGTRYIPFPSPLAEQWKREVDITTSILPALSLFLSTSNSHVEYFCLYTTYKRFYLNLLYLFFLITEIFQILSHAFGAKNVKLKFQFMLDTVYLDIIKLTWCIRVSIVSYRNVLTKVKKIFYGIILISLFSSLFIFVESVAQARSLQISCIA